MSAQNALLNAALAGKRSRLIEQLKHVSFEAGEQLWAAGDVIPYALFPLQGVISLQLAPPSKQMEVAIVGREGFAGVILSLGGQSADMIAIAVTRGEALVIAPDEFQQLLRDRVFRTAVERYARFFIVMLAQLYRCSRIHSIDTVYIGRLLLMQDRSANTVFDYSQESLARLLAVRRATVSRAAIRLQQLGIIQYDSQGRLTILDRGKLEALACPCYQAIKAAYDKFIG